MNYADSKLFTPITLRDVTFKNRIVMAPMTRNACPGNVHTDLAAPYYARRVKGGAGLIIGEASPIGHPASNAYENCPFFYGEEALASWKRIVDAVHEAGGKFWPQLWHVGGVRELGTEPDPSVPGYSPSGFLDPDKRDGHTMTKQDIKDVIKAYAEAAKAAKDMGCDGIEFHACHGYLVDEFFWDRTNERTDEYGGSWENRTRFAVEVLEAMRKQVGEGFPIGMRISQWKHQIFDVKMAQNPDELKEFLDPLVKAGVDIFHCSTRRYWEPEFDGSSLNFAGWVKKITGVPTMTVGSVGLDSAFVKEERGSLEVVDDFCDSARPASVDGLIKSIDAEEFDMVVVGRAILADPDWPNKLREGRSSEHIAYSKAMLMELK